MAAPPVAVPPSACRSPPLSSSQYVPPSRMRSPSVPPANALARQAKDTHADPAAVQELLAEDARTTALNEAEFQNRKAKRESLARRRQHSEEVAAEHRQVLTGLEALLNNALAGHDYKAAKHLHDQILRKEELFKDTDELASCFALCCCRGRRAAADDEMDEHVEAFEVSGAPPPHRPPPRRPPPQRASLSLSLSLSL